MSSRTAGGGKRRNPGRKNDLPLPFTAAGKINTMWKKISASILLVLTAGVLLIAAVEYYNLYTHRRLSKIEVLQIGLKPCSVTLPLKQSEAALPDPSVKIELYTKEGPFWIESDRTFSDLRICSSRMTGLMVFYSWFDIPDRREKEKLLQFIRSERMK